MARLEKVVYLTEAQLATLVSNGTITSNNNTVNFSTNDLYITPDSHSTTDFIIDNVNNNTASSTLSGTFSGTLEDGSMIIFYTRHPMAASAATITLDGTNAIPIYIDDSHTCTIPFPKGSMLFMVYYTYNSAGRFYLVNTYSAAI